MIANHIIQFLSIENVGLAIKIELLDGSECEILLKILTDRTILKIGCPRQHRKDL